MVDPISLGVSLLPTAFKFFSGLSQKRQANRMNPRDPGYSMNTNILDNAKTLGDRYSNYQMEGYGAAKDNIGAGYASAFNTGVQGASSGGDVLDLASKMSFNQGQNLNQLALSNNQGKEQALQEYMNANAMAGNEKVKKNQYELEMYQRKLAEKAALLQAGNQNMFSAGDDAANAVRSFTQPQQQMIQPSANGTIKIGNDIFTRQ